MARKSARKTRIDQLDKLLEEVSTARNQVLRLFRLHCKHLRLAEELGSPPHRICMDCGAIEEGWHCGYQVLVLQAERDPSIKRPPRAIVNPNAERRKLDVMKRGWPPYFIGQSHPNFPNSRCGMTKSLVEIKIGQGGSEIF